MSGPPESFSQLDISEHEKDKLVGDVIRYVLFKTEHNGGCPIKREELTQLITGKGYRQRNLPAFVINEAQSKLSSIFGYEMRELQRSRTSANHGRASQQPTSEAKSYIIISQLPADVYTKFVEDKSRSHMTGFTFVVVGIIHLDGGKVAEAYLQKEKVSGPEGNTVYYELAERALDPPTNDRIKAYVAQIVQKEATNLEAD
ncbi:hypothetical protein OROGR_003946 [Orobanche gracilis]